MHLQELECEGYSDIKLLFLPPNIKSLIQPMNQRVIESFKRRYCRKLLSEILGNMDNKGSTGLILALKTINMKDVIYMEAKAYDEMPSSTFTKSWRKAWPNSFLLIEKYKEDNPKPDETNIQDFEPDDNASLLKDLQRLPHSDDLVQQDVAEWIAGQDEELQNEILNDDEIVQSVIYQEDEEEEVNEEEGNVEEKMSHTKGRAALELATTYIEQQTEANTVVSL